jgi:hypothetical protein
MAGWGTGSFENDDAQDFLGRLKSLRIEDLRRILARAADQESYLEAPESSAAIAAAEVVASLVISAQEATAKEGALPPAAPRQIADWIKISEQKAEAPPELVNLARRAVQRVRVNSELKDLWLEADGLNEWNAALRDLEERLRG